jgi:DNA-binding transcriptional ArsR family regulator
MSKESESVLQKLEDIRKSMESFNETLNRVRYDDYKRALSDQIQSIFGDNSGTLFDSGVEKIQELSQCARKEECVRNLREMKEDTLAAFSREDIAGAMSILEDFEGELACDHSPCKDETCSGDTVEMLHHIKVLLSISDNLMFRNYIQPETGFTRLSSQGRFFSEHRRATSPELPSEELSQLVDPLSNPFRIEILKMLSREEMSFSQISRALDLRTGHLQFHLKALKEAGYLRSSRRRKVYIITARGKAALEGLQRLYEGITAVKPRPSAIRK